MSDKTELLRALRVFEKVPPQQLAALGQFLKSRTFDNGALIFEEGDPGESLFFIAGGHVRISKKIAGEERKDLAVLASGDCFGEMAVLVPAPRSARASAVGRCVVLELGRQDLTSWLEENQMLAVGFLTEMLQLQSRRLRHTSSELALLYDLSTLLTRKFASSKDLLGQVLGRVVPHLEGRWSAAAYLYNIFNQETEQVAIDGGHDFSDIAIEAAAARKTESCWIKPKIFFVPLPSQDRAPGFLLFRCETEIGDEEREDQARMINAVARLVTAAAENISFRAEEALRERLKKQEYGPTI